MNPDEAWLYYLCLNIGVKHPDHLDQCLNEEQLGGWRRFFNHYPFGQIRDDYHFALLQFICSQQRNKKWESFAPRSPFQRKQQRRRQTDREIRQTMQGFRQRVKEMKGSLGNGQSIK